MRKKEAPKLRFGVWSQDGYLGSLRAREAFSVKLPPGEHFFFAANLGASVMRGQLEAGKRYYALVDYGVMFGRVRLTPLTAPEDPDKLLKDVDWVRLDPALVTDAVRDRERCLGEHIRDAGDKIGRGELGSTELGPAQAF